MLPFARNIIAKDNNTPTATGYDRARLPGQSIRSSLYSQVRSFCSLDRYMLQSHSHQCTLYSTAQSITKAGAQETHHPLGPAQRVAGLLFTPVAL